MTRRARFKDSEKHLSQIPALHLLQKMYARMDHAAKGRGGPRAPG